MCTNCKYSSPRWLGRCPECDAWNSFEELDVMTKNKGPKRIISSVKRPMHEITNVNKRISSGFSELDQVLGGGVLLNSLILLSGEPGIGKSTLTLKICEAFGKQDQKVLYISGEESAEQISSRAQRMHLKHQEQLTLLNETNLEAILSIIKEEKSDLIIVDSIQVVSSENFPSIAGSMNQVRYCTEELMTYAKQNACTIIIIGHVTKEGTLAGPKVLEHLVDTVLLIEGERYQNLRLVRSIKNRFGSTNEVGIFEMTEEGLQQVDNPSELFLDGHRAENFGSSITTTIEGTRPILLEVQALTNPTAFGYPKRTVSGFDLNRLQLLAAVIQKHLNLNLNSQDIYVNIVGGYKLNDPAADLATVVAMISSFKKKALPSKTIFLGEVGLGSEIRNIQEINKRLAEAEKLGFTTAVIPHTKKLPKTSGTLKLIPIKNLSELLNLFF